MLQAIQEINQKVLKQAKELGKRYYFGRFLPNTNVMFVAEMPTNPKNSKDWNPEDNFNLNSSDRKFIDLLDKYGLGGSYITDVVKTTAKPRRPTTGEIKMFAPYLLQEIDILKPKLVVALGHSAYECLLNIESIKVPIRRIWHPSYVGTYGKWSSYEKQIESIAKELQRGIRSK